MGIIEAIMHAIAPVLALIAAPALAEAAGSAAVIDVDALEIYGQRIRPQGTGAPSGGQ